ncbi:MAG: Nif3-like dinuclear metal center hexameric protein [Planctomycetes bacterium]|nr:Nif3-like dinuclear metal center hexameric protein [Planctomycetota bacterium]
MAVSVERVLQAVREQCPPRFALEGDATGFQLGDGSRQIERVLCTLDLTLEVAEEAVRRGAGLVISHHAVIFRPLRHLRADDFKARIVTALIKGDVAVYVPHTAMDVVAEGMNDHLARSVGLGDTRFLEQTGSDERFLLRVADPALEAPLGERGVENLEVVGGRLEGRVRAPDVGKVLRFLGKRGITPTLVPLAEAGAARGIGRIGRLARPEPVADLARRLKSTLGAPGVRVVTRDPQRPIERVAVLGGDGRRFLSAAIRAGADALVTGDVDHHTALEARARGLDVIDVGHWASERQVSALLVEGLRARLDGLEVEVLASEVDTQPFVFV